MLTGFFPKVLAFPPTARSSLESRPTGLLRGPCGNLTPWSLLAPGPEPSKYTLFALRAAILGTLCHPIFCSCAPPTQWRLNVPRGWLSHLPHLPAIVPLWLHILYGSLVSRTGSRLLMNDLASTAGQHSQICPACIGSIEGWYRGLVGGIVSYCPCHG